MRGFIEPTTYLSTHKGHQASTILHKTLALCQTVASLEDLLRTDRKDDDEKQNKNVIKVAITFQSTSVPDPPRLTHLTTSGWKTLQGLPTQTSCGIGVVRRLAVTSSL